MVSKAVERELVELFEIAMEAADRVAHSKGPPKGEEQRCLDALKALRSVPVNTSILLSTGIGKKLRIITRHPIEDIRTQATELFEVWKKIVSSEINDTNENQTSKSQAKKPIKKPSNSEYKISSQDESSSRETKPKYEKTERIESSNARVERKKNLEKDTATKPERGEASKSSVDKKFKGGEDKTKATVEKRKYQEEENEIPRWEKERIGINGKPEEDRMPNFDKKRKLKENRIPICDGPELIEARVDKNLKIEEDRIPNDPPQRPINFPKCNDPPRDKYRELVANALNRVYSEADGDDLERANKCDPGNVADKVETALFKKLGNKDGPQKMKYRSIFFNMNDQRNPDFRRRVLLGEVEPERLYNISADEMASDELRLKRQRIKDKALFDCERGISQSATTDQFKCGKCGQRKTSYYQMQTRSADEPMTTFVTCVNCNNHWKFC
ncbi:hypothetical protein SUGI_0199640 [Cryptomeria japonica]|uniref:transcription elongation factor TFIIS-like n=1 Tax=Cryptomeria japonica TaxID=3369 RepID=UPI002408EF4C|nr:transcription elongation factor TFIIS-like [Cryptomeria japonica]GLJ12872.1 hypothetical protein SUGI_0199640 [Cryptomeria japonica]